MDDGGDGRGAPVAAGLSCGSCSTQLGAGAKFCSQCGAAVSSVPHPAEYKQVTVLFADVVHSMDIAAAVGAERLREIMADLADRCASVVQRYGGSLSQFTGDGIMAVFGAPIALEDHAFRACLAALGIQEEAKRLAVGVHDRDGVDLRLRVGLNSGQVIAGEIGSGPFGYTTIGEQVGMAQRMEAVAPPGGVMLSASTARLVDGAAGLGEPELVHIKGADEPVVARRLFGMSEDRHRIRRAESNLRDRSEGLLDVPVPSVRRGLHVGAQVVGCGLDHHLVASHVGVVGHSIDHPDRRLDRVEPCRERIALKPGLRVAEIITCRVPLRDQLGVIDRRSVGVRTSRPECTVVLSVRGSDPSARVAEMVE